MTDSAPSSYKIVCCDRCGSMEHIKRYKLKSAWIVTCKGCGLSFVNPRPSTERILEKLQSWAEQDVVDRARLNESYGHGSMTLYKHYLGRIKKYCADIHGKNILDIGCGVGAFLDSARRNGWNAEGLEIGLASSDYARDVKKLNVATGSIYSWKGRPDSYDAIVMMDVIEHMESPRTALEHIHRWLKKDGVLMLTTPNFNSLFRRLFGQKWWVINCEDEHIFFFTAASLSGLLQDIGYKVVYVYIRGIDLQGIARQSARSLFHPNETDETETKKNDNYYTARDRKHRLKTVLDRTGMLNFSRLILKGLYQTFTWRYSPLYEMGEQLVIIAKKHEEYSG